MKRLIAISICIMAAVSCLAAASTVTVDAGHPAGKVSPLFYGIMTEEINHAYDGGLYAELIQNRAFLDDRARPVHWSLIEEDGGSGAMALDSSHPVNEALATCLKLTVNAAAEGRRVGVANGGYW